MARLTDFHRQHTCLLWTWWNARNKANAKEGMPVIEEVQHKTMEAALNSRVFYQR
jgi:hypothetical protein